MGQLRFGRNGAARWVEVKETCRIGTEHACKNVPSIVLGENTYGWGVIGASGEEKSREITYKVFNE